MKILKWFVLVVVAVAAIAVVTLVFWGGNVIKEGVNRVGPQVLGVPVKLDSARFYPLRGHVSLTGMFVGNPEGFNTESLFDMKHLEIDLNVKSLFTDTIIIDRILIDSPQITYEVGVRGTNLGALLEKLESASDTDDDEAPVEEVKPGKNVVIKELILADARAQVSATAMRGRVVPVQLSTITLNDLGGEDQSLTQITTEVLKAVLGAVGNAVAGAGDLLGDGLKSALDGVGALGGMATDGARAVTDAAGEGARAVTGAVGDGLRGVRGMVGGDKKEEDTDSEAAAPEVEIPPDVSDKVDKAAEKATKAADKAEEKLKDGASRISGALGGLRSRDEEKE